MAFDRLLQKIQETGNRTVMGLDPTLDFVPPQIKAASIAQYGNTLEGAGDAIFTFCRGLIDSAADLLPAVKPQSAFFELYGIPGMIALNKTIRYARETGLYVILDAKRGDIGSTAAAYASGLLGLTKLDDTVTVEAMSADCLTVNPYLGIDGVKPFVDTAEALDKSIFVLVKTSNPSSAEFQDIHTADTRELYLHVAEKVSAWGAPSVTASGYSAVGAVVGATYPRQLAQLRALMPHTFLLIPGYGAQGGTARDVAFAFDANKTGAIVNSSRGLMCAYQKAGDNGENYQKHTRAAVLAMRDDINAAL